MKSTRLLCTWDVSFIFAISHLSKLCLRCSLLSMVSAPTSLGRQVIVLDVRSSLLRDAIPHRNIGMSLKRLQLRSRSVRLVRKVKFCGRLPTTFFEALRLSRFCRFSGSGKGRDQSLRSKELFWEDGTAHREGRICGVLYMG